MTYRTNVCAELEETSNYKLVLDKIIVNTGDIEAEYKVNKNINLSSILRELKISPIEYIRNWCNQHSNTMSNDVGKEDLYLSGSSANDSTLTEELEKLHLKDDKEDISKKTKTKKIYSDEIEKTLQKPRYIDDAAYKDLEEVISKEFSNPDSTPNLEEGVEKDSFSYLFLDSRLTNKLPKKKEEETWQTFLNSIFYVGKGKQDRPYSHLKDAVALWNDGILTTSNPKLQHILDIWKDGGGVVCLMVFQNVISNEAYTREAAMISALTLKNITNAQGGQFHGTSKTWTSKQKNMLGTLLLYKAMQIFLREEIKTKRHLNKLFTSFKNTFIIV